MEMNFFQAAVLGIVQGVTEFLPISSSGHLVLMQNVLGFTEPDIFFDVCLHVGTLIAVCVFLRRDILEILRVFFMALKSPGHQTLRSLYNEEPAFRLLALTAAGTVVTVVIVLLFQKHFENMFASVAMVGAALIITGAVLWCTRWSRKPDSGVRQVGMGKAAAIGVAQALAVTPGLSRSGLTIACGLYLGLERDLAVRLSFLLSIPAILGAVVLQFDVNAFSSNSWHIVVGMFFSAISGFAALKILAILVKHGRLWVFAPYCWAVGLTILVTKMF
jgi:undecaprenyl-diphosphatase